jgi:hypothetical protein
MLSLLPGHLPEYRPLSITNVGSEIFPFHMPRIVAMAIMLSLGNSNTAVCQIFKDEEGGLQ